MKAAAELYLRFLIKAIPTITELAEETPELFAQAINEFKELSSDPNIQSLVFQYTEQAEVVFEDVIDMIDIEGIEEEIPVEVE